MTIAIFASIPSRQQLSSWLGDGNTVANYQPGNFTGTLNASAWLNSIGAAPSLAQASGAAQPIIVSADYVKKAYLPGVAGNTFTAANKTVTGTRTFVFNVALNDYSPAADVTLVDKSSGNDGFIIKWLTTDKVRFVVGDGAGLTNVDMAAATTLTDATQHTISIAWEDGVGATFSIDGVASAQVAAAKTLTNAAVSLTIGGATSIGKVYSVSVSGLYGFNASDWSETSTNGTTAVSSTTGETWTLNNTGALPAQIVGSPSLLFDGIAHLMSTGAFTLNQPTEIILVGKQLTWVSGAYIIDGLTSSKNVIVQNATLIPVTSPSLSMFAGTEVARNAGWPLNTLDVIRASFNGASSLLQVGIQTASTGNAGANNAGGLTVGGLGGGGSNFTNIQMYEIIVRNAASSADWYAQVYALLKLIYGIP